MAFKNSEEKTFTRHHAASTCLLTYANQHRKQSQFNDVIIETDAEDIPANRMVLSCYSVFFEKMFKSEMKEKYLRSIKVKGITGSSLQLLIDYFYSGQISINKDNVTALLTGADYLQLDDVKQFCFDFMNSSITSSNCLFILDMAQRYGDTQLKQNVYQFILKNFAEIVKEEDYKSLSKTDFLSCVSEIRYYKLDQRLLCQSIFDWTAFDEKTRTSALSDLLKFVDFKRLSLTDLEKFLSNDLIYQNSLCSKCVNFHLLELIKEKRLNNSETKILSLGGGWSSGKVSEVFNLMEKTNLVYPNLDPPLQSHCSIKHNNYIYCIGGYSNSNSTTKVKRMYLKEKNDFKWENVASMNCERSSFGAALFNDYLVVAGGCNANNQQLSQSECYNIDSNQWQAIAPVIRKRRANKLLTCENSLFLIGGFDGKRYLASVEKLHNIDGEWYEVASMQTERCYFAAVSCGGFIYAIGGIKSNFCDLKTVEKYDPYLDLWTYVSSMNISKYDHCACVFRGKIFVVGGCNSENGPIKDIECYDPLLDKWFIVGRTEEILRDHSLVVV